MSKKTTIEERLPCGFSVKVGGASSTWVQSMLKERILKHRETCRPCRNLFIRRPEKNPQVLEQQHPDPEPLTEEKLFERRPMPAGVLAYEEIYDRILSGVMDHGSRKACMGDVHSATRQVIGLLIDKRVAKVNLPAEAPDA